MAEVDRSWLRYPDPELCFGGGGGNAVGFSCQSHLFPSLHLVHADISRYHFLGFTFSLIMMGVGFLFNRCNSCGLTFYAPSLCLWEVLRFLSQPRLGLTNARSEQRGLGPTKARSKPLQKSKTLQECLGIAFSLLVVINSCKKYSLMFFVTTLSAAIPSMRSGNDLQYLTVTFQLLAYVQLGVRNHKRTHETTSRSPLNLADSC